MLVSLVQTAALSPAVTHAEVWAIVGRVLTVLLGISGGVLLFTGRAIGKAIFCVFLKLCRNDLKATIDEIYEERIATVNEAMSDVGVHADQLEMLNAAVEAQGKALNDSLTRAIQQQTEAMQRTADSMSTALREIKATSEKIHDETSANTTAIAEISGFLRNVKNWNGSERRTRPTRKPEG